MSTKNPARARVDQVSADQKLIDGTNQTLSGVSSLTVGSQTLTPAAIVQTLQARVTTASAAETAKAAYAAAVKADRDQRAASGKLVIAYTRLVTAMYAESPDLLARFGLSAPKVAQRTAQSKAASAAKGAATRKADHAVAQPAQPVAPAAPGRRPPRRRRSSPRLWFLFLVNAREETERAPSVSSPRFLQHVTRLLPCPKLRSSLLVTPAPLPWQGTRADERTGHHRRLPSPTGRAQRPAERHRWRHYRDLRSHRRDLHSSMAGLVPFRLVAFAACSARPLSASRHRARSSCPTRPTKRSSRAPFCARVAAANTTRAG